MWHDPGVRPDWHAALGAPNNHSLVFGGTLQTAAMLRTLPYSGAFCCANPPSHARSSGHMRHSSRSACPPEWSAPNTRS